MFTKKLEQLGYEITPTTSSVKALELFRKEHGLFDLIVTDMTMPDMSGLELAKEMAKIRPETPVILLTGYDNPLTDNKAKENGICKVVHKPVTPGELGNLIREIFEIH